MTEEKINELRQLLINFGINIDNWGIGGTKTVEHLQKEIEDGESVLITDKDGNIFRKVLAVGADIYYYSYNKKYRLKEEKQVFKDGSQRTRDYGMAVTEKMKVDETPKEAVIRGIYEELGISGNINLKHTEIQEKTRSSTSYPGLKSQYICYNYEVRLKKEQFNPEGYIEQQTNKKTYFIWDEIDKQYKFDKNVLDFSL